VTSSAHLLWQLIGERQALTLNQTLH